MSCHHTHTLTHTHTILTMTFFTFNRCVRCVTCGATTPGIGCQWQNNYSQCGPCASISICPLCHRCYREDELIILCLHCERWLHANCDGILTEEEAERASDFGYHCCFCRPITGHAGPRMFTQFGICIIHRSVILEQREVDSVRLHV